MTSLERLTSSRRSGTSLRGPLIALFLLFFAASGKLSASDVIAPAGCEAIPNSYIVAFKGKLKEAKREEMVGWAQQMASAHNGTLGHVYYRAFRGFSIEMAPRDAQALAREPSVLYVEKDCVVEAYATQLNPPNWGLDRIDQRDLPLDSSYTYDTDGAGVHLYVIDSGLRTTHNQFTGRVGAGHAVVGGDVEDCTGHGTHVTGIAAGTTYGVAKGVTIHPVRVFECSSSGSASDVIEAVDWVTDNRIMPAVVNMSLGVGAGDSSLDSAVANSIAEGITYVVAAGNASSGACTTSPARVSAALTVGASMIDDRRWSGSNTGSCVDLFAPGASILSAGHQSDTQSSFNTGTSMASPHVAGLAALVLDQNPSASPAAVGAEILTWATPDRLSDIPAGTANLLLNAFSPLAAFDPDCTCLTCTLDGRDSSDNNGIASWSWDFGDGTTGSGALRNHSYSSSGTYQVRLTVTDTSGLTDSVTRMVTVEECCTDSTRPNVSITQPTTGDYIWGTQVVTADATDNVGVTKVEFRVDGSRKCTDSTPPYTCSLNVNDFSPGLHEIKARAFDACNNSRNSAPVNVFFVSEPVTNIDTPGDGQVLSGSAARISGWASDPDGITSLTVQIDGQTIPSTYGLVRQDVCDAVPLSDPNCPGVGFEAIFDTRNYDNGPHTLTITATNGAGETVVAPDPPRSFGIGNQCASGSETICLQGNRFEATLTWEDPHTGAGGTAQAFPHPTSDATGYFWFYGEDNLEVGVKILDGAPVGSPFFWAFHGAATTLDYELTITDTMEATTKVYQKTGTAACGGGDTQAFPQGATAPFAGSVPLDSVPRSPGAFPSDAPSELGAVSLPSRSGSCIAGNTSLCLFGNRFEVKVLHGGIEAAAQPLNDQNGDFHFFSPDNREVLVKILDARDFEGFFWVFYGSMTAEDFQVVITDTVTGAQRTYSSSDDWCGGYDLQAFSD